MKTKVVLVTPSYNSSETIGRTFESVLSLKGTFELFYHVQDGGSTDETMSIINHYSKIFDNASCASRKINFTFRSSPDNGMYDAIQKVFDEYDCYDDNVWFSWINSDDTLDIESIHYLSEIDDKLTADVKWVTGKASVVSLDGTKNITSIKLNSCVIHSGLCDGKHWNYVQQEGTFFRKELWDFFRQKNDLSRFKYASDWFLWFELAKKYEIFQIDKVMGNFHKTPGQISELHAKEYFDETAEIVSPPNRKLNLNKINIKNGTKRDIDINEDGNLILSSGTVLNHKKYRLDLLDKELRFLKYEDAVVSYNADWQYPAKTEKHAFEKIIQLRAKSKNTLYIAFPWATFIDLLNNNKNDANILKNVLIDIRQYAKKFKKVITVCQHIHMMKYQEFFDFVHVTDVFWTHAIKDQLTFSKFKNINIHAFPLFPVQVCEEDFSPSVSKIEKNILYSFVGARASKYYLTNSRNLILNLLGSDKNGVVISRDSWHYDKIVYGHQIHKSTSQESKLIDDSASNEFKEILNRSIFSLCPSGSGPNSIRLWESIGFGSIPVILADTYLPPGNRSLWDEAVVYCEETPEAIKALPERLELLSKDEGLIERKRHALKQLWMLYGPDHFVYDISKLFLSYETSIAFNKSQKIKFKNSIRFLMEKNTSNAFLCSSIISRLLVNDIDLKSEMLSNPEVEKLVKSLAFNQEVSNSKVLIELCKKKGVIV